MGNIIIYGGSFDPVHNDHIRIAIAAQKELSGVLFFLPNARPRWKSPGVAISDRIAMLRLAIKDLDPELFKIDGSELEAEGKDTIYSVDTLHQIKAKYPKENIYFLIGGDSVNTFDDWRDPDAIAHLSHIVYVRRKGQSIDMDNVKRYKMQEIRFGSTLGTSSSLVRSMKSYDIDKGVRDYIEEHRLYYVEKLSSIMSKSRLNHSISVARLAEEILMSNHIDHPERGYFAGLVHDIAKDLDPKALKSLIYRDHPEFIPFPEWTYHQFAGESILSHEWGIQDEQLLSAVACHATGKMGMSTLDKVIYSADKIEPTRGYDSRYMIGAMMGDIDKGFRLVLEENMKYLASKGYKIDNALTAGAVNQYLKGE